MFPKTSAVLIAVLGCGCVRPAFGQSEPDYKALKEQVESLKAELEKLKTQQAAIIQQLVQMQRHQQALSNPVIDLKGAAETGSTTAKVAIVEFTDFWCGFCARFAKNTLPELI